MMIDAKRGMDEDDNRILTMQNKLMKLKVFLKEESV